MARANQPDPPPAPAAPAQERCETIPRTALDDTRLREIAEGFRSEAYKPEAGSAEWWREVAQGLAVEVGLLRAVEDKARWAEFLENWVDYHHGDGNSDRAWEDFLSGERPWRRIR